MKWVILLALCACIEGYKILVCYSLPFRSLNILGEGYVRHLLNAGHEVTYITAYPLKNKPSKNFKEIDVSSLQNFYQTEADILNISYIMSHIDHSNDVALLQDLGLNVAIRTLEHPNIQVLLRDNTQQFDAVVIELLDTEIYAGMAALYNCPLIWSYSMGPNNLVMQLVDEPANPAYTTDILSSNIPPFTFQQRVEELWNTIKWNGNKWFLMTSKYAEAFTRIFGPLFAIRGLKLPAYEEVAYNASLVLSNYYNAMGNIPKLPQNFRLIGGYHIETPAKPLPKDLQTIMDNAKHGVIYFSMGSIWKSKDIPPSVTEGLLKVFGGLKQTVIWKYEEDLPNRPENVHVLKWAPQQSVLAHPNTLFFISHGGLLSSTETIHFGVPQIGIPIYYDQFTNIDKAVANGYAIKVDLNFDLPQNLKQAIDKMLTDQRYKQRVKHFSSLYHDRPLPPAATLVWWLEHVVRTNGAAHLNSPSRFMPWYQKMYLDLAAILFAIIFFVWKILLVMCAGKKAQKRKKE